MTRMNRHALKRKHKRELEKKYTIKMYNGDPRSVKEFKAKLEEDANDVWWIAFHHPRNNGWEYWKNFYLSGRRQYAKKYTDKRIRQKYRQMIHHFDPEDVTAPQGSDYEKEFDYNWIIW